MKMLFIAILCIASPFCANAQITLLGKTEDKVNETLIHLDYIKQERSVKVVGKNKVLTLVYYPRTETDSTLTARTFLFKNNVCVNYIISDFLKGLPDLLAAIKDKYIRIDDTHWIDKMARVKGTLLVDRVGYTFSFERM